MHIIFKMKSLAVLFSLNGFRAPDPNGYGAHFCRIARSILQDKVGLAIKNFFTTAGKLLVEVIAKVISLVPKIQTF